ERQQVLTAIMVSVDTLEIATSLLPPSSHMPTAQQQPNQQPTPPNYLLAVPQHTADRRLPSLQAVERNYILTVLQQTDWVITGPRGAARLLDLPPSTLRNRMKKLGITSTSHHVW